MYDPNSGYPRIVPYVLYADPTAAVRWLTDVLGLRQLLRVSMPDGTIGHAELAGGSNVLMVGVKGGRFGHVSSITLVFVDDVDATCRQAVAAGGSVLQEAADYPWGVRQAVVADPEGQRWEISQYLKDVPPQAWGAEIVD